jgi:hypothetical protein
MTKWRFLRRRVFCSLGHTHRKRRILACIMNLCLIRLFVQRAWRRVGQQVDKTASSHHRHETTALLLSRKRPARWQRSSQAVSREVSVYNVDGQQGRRHAIHSCRPSVKLLRGMGSRTGLSGRVAVVGVHIFIRGMEGWRDGCMGGGNVSAQLLSTRPACRCAFCSTNHRRSLN